MTRSMSDSEKEPIMKRLILSGPFSSIPQFSGIGYPMEFSPTEHVLTNKVNQFGDRLTLVGTVIIMGPDVNDTNIYTTGSNFYYE